MKKYILFFLIISCVFAACKDDDFSTDPSYRLSFSTEELTFDTVFTTIGSTTQSFMVYNTHKNPLKINRIELQPNSNFRMNVSGISASSLSDVEIRANDSMFVFVEVTVNPNDENSPFLIEDEIRFYTNTNLQTVKLTAYGQNAVILRSETISENTTFTSEKPYLIFGTLLVDENASLTIEKNCSLFFHNNAGITAQGDLQINGTLEEPVVMRGDRLDYFLKDNKYDYLPGQWNGIELLGNGKNYTINFAEIRNAQTGIKIENTAVKIENSSINNFDKTAIEAKNAEIYIGNSLIANAREHCLKLVGGSHKIIQSTFADYYSNMSSGKGRDGRPMISLSNYAYADNEKTIKENFDLTQAEFTNCIIYGSVLEEIGLLEDSETPAAFNYSFSHCLIKDKVEKFNESSITKVIWGEDPLFISMSHPYNFGIKAESPAIGKAEVTVLSQYPFDLLGNARTNNTLGAYEFVAE
jgi:hypothetical protein